MSIPYRTRMYLQKHHIASLFEELETRLKNDLPDEPLSHLILILQKKLERAGKNSHLRRSTGNLAKLKADTSPEIIRKSVTGQRLLKSSSPVKGSDSASIDDIWNNSTKQKTTIKEKNIAALNNQQPKSLYDFKEFKNETSVDLHPNKELDLLNDEFSLVSDDTTTDKKLMVKDSLRNGKKTKNCQNMAQKRKENLKMILLDIKHEHDSGIDDDQEVFQEDDAVELIEDTDLLLLEGVNIKTKQSNKLKPNVMSDSKAVQEPIVRVSICERCACVIEGMPSEVDHQPETYRSELDEEFESVSQVTGPRKPVWHEQLSNDVTPRKGLHMFSASKTPAKVRSMFSSEDFFTTNTTGKKSPKPELTKTWNPSNSSKTNLGLNVGEQVWQSVDTDTDVSSVDWKRDSKKRQNYIGAF